ncbi:FT-interacting protein 1 [Senna tora]|uniref:FT-interacting protein 1 n=1 Tax=Senna tora TaxID=362788 RepID=A0A834WDW4_9FABA|nr:FT-interacting protein 1 [Senna tora]
MGSQAASKPKEQDDYKLKDTKPELGEKWPHGGQRGGSGWISSERATSTYDLVEQMFYLYVRVVKAKDLPPNPVTGNCDPYVEVKVGNYKGKTRHFEKKSNPEWKQVFAFSKEKIQSSQVEVFVRDKEMVARDDYIGKVVFDMHEVPTRVPPDSPLAPQWYRLEDRRGDRKVKGEVMLAVWMGTQADEAFPEAWHSDAASVQGEGVYTIRSKVYVSPKLWYVRVNVIEAQDVEPRDKSQPPQAYVKAQVGQQVLKTKLCPTKTPNPFWNEDLIFVAAEPFEEQLVLTVENKIGSKDEIVGRISLQLTQFEKRLDHRAVHSRWYNLESFGFGALEGDKRHELKFSTRIHLRVCLEGAYHVLDESTMYISDTRPTARQLWKQPVGILEVGILSAQGLQPMKTKDGKSTTDAYCVAKYGQKWVRTRTITDSSNPKWKLILPTFFLYMFVIGVWNFRFRPRHPPHMDTKVSWAEAAQADELDEEFDTFPTSKGQDVVKMRYDRLRSVAGRIQTVVGDIATQGERFHALLNWRDPRATCLFVIFCLVAAVALYITPFKMVAAGAGVYWLRHPRFRSKLPSAPSNFFRRLPSRADTML